MGPQPTVMGPQPVVMGPQPTVMGPQPTVMGPQPIVMGPQPIGAPPYHPSHGPHPPTVPRRYATLAEEGKLRAVGLRGRRCTAMPRYGAVLGGTLVHGTYPFETVNSGTAVKKSAAGGGVALESSGIGALIETDDGGIVPLRLHGPPPTEAAELRDGRRVCVLHTWLTRTADGTPYVCPRLTPHGTPPHRRSLTTSVTCVLQVRASRRRGHVALRPEHHRPHTGDRQVDHVRSRLKR
jgi:hypothetical protein